MGAGNCCLQRNQHNHLAPSPASLLHHSPEDIMENPQVQEVFSLLRLCSYKSPPPEIRFSFMATVESRLSCVGVSSPGSLGRGGSGWEPLAQE